MNTPVLRFPAEWEPQSAVLIAWPHAGTDWAQRLGEVEETYVALVAAITRFQPAWICVADDDLQTYAEARLRSARVDMDRVRFIAFDYDDTWLRDSGPIVLREGDGFRVLDFHFTAWGGKFEAGRDDRLVESLAAQGVFGAAPRQRIDFALEGGGIETDGAGTLLTTWRCLHERHPQASRDQLDSKLRGWLAQDRVLWLDHGCLEGDDTDAHIDTLARFAADDAIVFQACDDPADPHYAELQAMAAELAALRTRDGRPSPALGSAHPRRRPAPGRVLCQLPDRQRRGIDAGLRRPCRRPCGRGAGRCLPGPRDRAGTLPPADLAERQPALHHHADPAGAGRLSPARSRRIQ